jgi:ribonuclease HII
MDSHKKTPNILERFYNAENDYEICLDEAGRGCLYGRVYIASVVLPKDPSLFDGINVKDSKKFTSKKKIQEVAEYIKSHALHWEIAYCEAEQIDKINILQSVMCGMHQCIRNTLKVIDPKRSLILVDGNYFKPVTYLNKATNRIETIPHVTIEGGDNKYAAIAAASILAKVERDSYIEELCEQNPTLSEHYGIDSNKGYGAKRHLDGIKEHGITIWHRRSFGTCKNYV